MTTINVPNLFLIVGQPEQGKTTLSNAFEKHLTCEVIHTDELFVDWIKANGLISYRPLIKPYYLRLPVAIRRAWNEYLTAYLIAALDRIELNLVVEGWILSYIPIDLQICIERVCKPLVIRMRRFIAYYADKSVSASNGDYGRIVDAILNDMSNFHTPVLARES